MPKRKIDTMCKLKANPNDELYTPYKEIEKYFAEYPSDYFKNKVVYCNCDDYEISNFVKYFVDNAEKLDYYKLIATSYTENGRGKYYYNDGYYHDNYGIITKELNGDGSYDSPECQDYLAEADIVVTNPPFSKSNDFIKFLELFGKEYFIISNLNIVKNKGIRDWILSGHLKMTTPIKDFENPKGEHVHVGVAYWFTNVKDCLFVPRTLQITKEYNEKDYPVYDDYPAIHIDSVYSIPKDYKGLMAVPVNIVEWDLSDFEIIGFDTDLKKTQGGYNKKSFMLKGKRIYSRLVIRRKV